MMRRFPLQCEMGMGAKVHDQKLIVGDEFCVSYLPCLASLPDPLTLTTLAGQGSPCQRPDSFAWKSAVVHVAGPASVDAWSSICAAGSG